MRPGQRPSSNALPDTRGAGSPYPQHRSSRIKGCRIRRPVPCRVSGIMDVTSADTTANTPPPGVPKMTSSPGESSEDQRVPRREDLGEIVDRPGGGRRPSGQRC